MIDALRTWATPYGGDAFLYLAVLAALSVVALAKLHHRMSVATLRRCIRLSALVALPLTFISTQATPPQPGVAVVAIAWCVVVAIVCQRAVLQRNDAKK